MKLQDFAENIYFPNVSKHVRLNTLRGYESGYYNHVKPRFGEYELEAITFKELQEYIDSFEKPGAALKSYRVLRQIIRTAIYYYLYNGVDPTSKHIILPKTSGNKNKVLTAEEVSELLKGFRDNPLEACVICSVYLGLRRCESFGLKWEDIDLNTGSVYVQRSRQTIDGKVYVYPPKTKLSKRVCYLPQYAIDRLKEIQGTGWLLGEYTPCAAAKEYRQHIKRNNLPYTTFMNLRHTWATLAIDSGADISTVARMMGHTDITMAYNRYIRPTENMYRKVQDNIKISI